MNIVSIYNPGKLVFGPGALKHAVRDYTSSDFSRIYILSIQTVLDSIENQLDDLGSAGIQLLINTSLSAEPTFSDFERLIAEVRSFRPDSIAGIGGGSVMDMAKVLAAFAKNEVSIKDFTGTELLTERQTHLVCIPTTSGTGSEVSPNAILLDETDGGKKALISHFLVPDAACIDPELTLPLSPEITAYTGIDALTHCIEAYANRNAHPFVDTLALKGISLISSNLKQACRSGTNLEARSQLALGSLYGGMCLGPVNTGAVHALAYPLGSMYKIAHGLSNAVLLPHVLDYALDSAEDRYAEIAGSMGINESVSRKDLSKALPAAVKQLLTDCGIPLRLRDIGIPEESIEPMARSAIQLQRLLRNSPCEIGFNDATNIYHQAY